MAFFNLTSVHDVDVAIYCLQLQPEAGAGSSGVLLGVVAKLKEDADKNSSGH